MKDLEDNQNLGEAEKVVALLQPQTSRFGGPICSYRDSCLWVGSYRGCYHQSGSYRDCCLWIVSYRGCYHQGGSYRDCCLWIGNYIGYYHQSDLKRGRRRSWPRLCRGRRYSRRTCPRQSQW